MEEKTQEQIDSEYQYDNGFKPKEVILKDNYVFYKQGFFSRLFCKCVILLTKFFLFFPKHLVWGYKIIGKKNKKYMKGSVIVSNHSFTFDAFSQITALWNKKIYTTTLQSNLGFGFVSKYFRSGGAVPIPTDTKLFRRFLRDTKDTLDKGYNILVYPEAMLMPFCDHIRKFEPGAFHIALSGSNKIIMMVHTYHKPKGFYKLTRRKKPCIHLNILEPYIIEDQGNRRKTMDKAHEDVHRIMSEYFNSHSDYFEKK